jgi:hypothetical protein
LGFVKVPISLRGHEKLSMPADKDMLFLGEWGFKMKRFFCGIPEDSHEQKAYRRSDRFNDRP